MQVYQKDSDYEANKFTLRAVGFSCVLFGIVWILNILGIFIVNDSIMNVGFFGSTLVYLFTFLISKKMGLSDSRTKYFLLVLSVINYDFICVMLTYHALLVTVLPILLSVQYRSKKMIRTAYLITAVGHVVCTFGGYHFGLCNANMLLFTSEPTSYYMGKIAAGGIVPGDPGMPIPLALFAFFVVPQWFILLAFLPILFHISRQIEIRVQNELMTQRQSQTDFMTGLGNRALYNEMMKGHYAQVKNIAVIIWDINDLRLINESQGYETGDTLVALAADSIKPLINAKQQAFRVGGDEFVLVIENPDDGDINHALLKWNNKLADLNSNSDIKLSAIVGYSQGEGKDMDFLVRDAYRMMSNQKDTVKMKAIPR
ncbi:MAG: diguanylate cyclase [Fibrobacter sp.]|nr:diguanylate cyclase [Fibrobacter sp.]